ncbi:MAG TPA: type II toxin-antitoxin system HicA family toxin [Longimicrobium sp.]
MSKLDKLIEKLLSGTSDANFSFSELRYILLHLGFDERIHGSHHVYRNAERPSVRAVLQPDGKNAKPYQVAQVRDAVLELNSGGADGSV